MAVSIDVGQLFLVKNDLQNVADAAALAGAKKLLQDKDGNGAPEVYCDEAIRAAIDCANLNFSFGSDSPIQLTDADVTIGKWNLATKDWDRTGCSANPMEVNAVQVTVNRAGKDGDTGNDKVSTFFGNVLGVGTQDIDPDTLIKTGPAKLTAAASSVAMLGLAGTSTIDLPFAVPKQYTAGQGVASHGFQRLLDKFAPAPAYAATKSYQWKDLGPGTFDTAHATFVVPTKAEQGNSFLKSYIWGPKMAGGKAFPQIKVGTQVWAMSEWNWGTYIKPTFQALKDRFNDVHTPKVNGKWRVTVPVFGTTPVTAALPQDSWFQLASRLLPGVSQAYACTGYTNPAVYTQGFITLDVVGVTVTSNCDQTGDQSGRNSCRNKCWMDVEVPLNDNTVSTDKGSNPIPFQKDYKDMFNPASEVGVFAAVPRLVK